MQVVVVLAIGVFLALGDTVFTFARQTLPPEAAKGVCEQGMRNTEEESNSKPYLVAIVNKIDYRQSLVELVTEIGLLEVPVASWVLQELQEGDVVTISFADERMGPPEFT